MEEIDGIIISEMSRRQEDTEFTECIKGSPLRGIGAFTLF